MAHDPHDAAADPDDAHGHAHGDGHDSAHPAPPRPHPHGEAPSASEGGAHHEPPPAPSPRSITPARSDYAVLASGFGLAWPLLWLLVATSVVLLYRDESRRGPVLGHDPSHDSPR